jgi:hypothetical protein
LSRKFGNRAEAKAFGKVVAVETRSIAMSQQLKQLLFILGGAQAKTKRRAACVQVGGLVTEEGVGPVHPLAAESS